MNSENSQPTEEAKSMQPESLADASVGEESQQIIESEAVERGTSINNQSELQDLCFATFTQCPTGVHLNPPSCKHRVNCLSRELME